MYVRVTLRAVMLMLLLICSLCMHAQSTSPSGFHYELLYFKGPPEKACLKELQKNGVICTKLKMPGVFEAALPKSFSWENSCCHPDSIYRLRPAARVDESLKAIPAGHDREVIIRCHPAERPQAVLEYFKRKDQEAHFVHDSFLIQTKLNQSELELLQSESWVQAIEPLLGNASPLDRPGSTLHRTLYIGNNFSGLPNLHGNAIVAGIGDGGFVAAHRDFDQRLTNTNLSVISGFGNHGDHNSGLIIGAGRISTSGEGMATQAKLYTAQVYGILDSTPSFYNNFGMTFTNNSYSYTPASCAAYGIYNLYSAYVDDQLHSYPKVLHFFAAGNSGSVSCAGYPAGFGNLESYFNVAKNAMMVGNADNTDNINAASSKGPAADGRLKPDIVGLGTGVFSTVPNNTYASKTGTSHSTPGVMGAAMLLAERYKQLHGDTLPDGELLKSVMLLTADDLGNAGPDFSYGYGRVNAGRAVEVLQNQSHFYNKVAQGDSQTYIVSVPTGSARFAVMLGWRDEAGNLMGPTSLMNDLDIKIYDPSGNRYLPWILDTTKANVNNPAYRGIDKINNHELVTIDTPASGNYTIRIFGSQLTSAEQDYHLAYHTPAIGLKLTYPAGKEKWISAQTEHIRWDPTGISSGTYTISYSSDSGATWSVIASALTSGTRNYAWTVPTLISGTCLMRIIHSSGTLADTCDQFFTITPKPSFSMTACDQQVRLSWSAISGASFYEVLQLDSNNTWNIAGTTTGTNYTINNQKNGVTVFAAVRLRKANITGDFGTAVSATPSVSNCGLATDIALYSLTMPSASGRQKTSTALSASQQIRVVIKNLGTGTLSSGVPVSYAINGGAPVSQTFSGSLAANATGTLTFTTTTNMSAVGTYYIKLWTGLATDNNRFNDTITVVLRQLANDTITLPYQETFESVPSLILNYVNVGMPGATPFDYSNTAATGRLRTEAGIGYYASGSRAITLDRNTNSATAVKNYLTCTLNLSNRDASQATNLYYDIKNHGEELHAADSLWVRGNDTLNWIKLSCLHAGLSPGTQYTVGPWRIDSVLKANSQNFSSSFQLRFGQEDDSASRMQHLQDGITLDNIKIVDAQNDVAIVAMVSPVSDCSLSTTQQIQINITNLGNAPISNIPVYFSVNGSVPDSGNISALAGNGTAGFTFPGSFNGAASGLYTIRIWAALAGDPNRNNDTLVATVRNFGWVQQFPYIENFENGPGDLYMGGNALWAWGTPSKTILESAANGNKCWVTGLTGNYPSGYLSYLNSGCFDFSSFSNDPLISLNRKFALESEYDFAWMEYSEDGTTWIKLGSHLGGFGWYNSNTDKWTGNAHAWTVGSHQLPLSAITQKNKVRLRWVFNSDNATVDEGFAFDDLNICDSPNEIYTGTGAVSAASSGSGWVDFNIGGKRVASLNDQGQMLGFTDCMVYKNDGPIRLKAGQPYLNRSWVIKPTVQPTSPCIVRLYLTAAELDSLIAVDSFAFSFQDFGVTKWSGATEDSSLSNNPTLGDYIPASGVAFYPFESGYFAEFEVSSFSELYINSGGSGGNTPLPLKILSFKATPQQSDARLEWTFLNEELAQEGALEWLQPNRDFVPMYAFNPKVSPLVQADSYVHSNIFDWQASSSYRLRIGTQFSEVITLNHAGVSAPVKLFPNPASKQVQLLSGGSDAIHYILFDHSGKEVMRGQGLQFDVSALSDGIYMLKCSDGNAQTAIRLMVVH